MFDTSRVSCCKEKDPHPDAGGSVCFYSVEGGGREGPAMKRRDGTPVVTAIWKTMTSRGLAARGVGDDG
jgi:hypothetical protein